MNDFRIVDSYIGQEGIIIKTEEDLKNELQSTFNREGNRAIILQSPKSGELLIGVGNQYGFVEYSTNSKELPYLIATDRDNIKPDDFYEFDSGGTPTPIPSDKCLPYDLVIEIAIFFFQNQKIPNNIKWEKE